MAAGSCTLTEKKYPSVQRLLLLILLILSLASLLPAQSSSGPVTDTANRYLVYKQTSLTTAAETITVQQPTTGAKIVVFEQATLYASVATDFTLSTNGTAATTTTLAVTPFNKGPAAKMLAFSASNTNTPTQTFQTYSVPAAGILVIDLSKYYMDNGATVQNLTITTSSVTGTVRIGIQAVEK